KALVLGDGGPAVIEDLGAWAAEIEHRLDREYHAWLQPFALAGLAVVQDVRRIVEDAPEAGAAEFAPDGAALGLGETLDREAEIAQRRAGLYCRDAAHQTLIRHVHEPLGFARDRTDRVHAARIAVPAIDDGGYVDIHDVTFAERLLARDAVADH